MSQNPQLTDHRRPNPSRFSPQPHSEGHRAAESWAQSQERNCSSEGTSSPTFEDRPSANYLHHLSRNGLPRCPFARRLSSSNSALRISFAVNDRIAYSNPLHAPAMRNYRVSWIFSEGLVACSVQLVCFGMEQPHDASYDWGGHADDWT